MNDRQSGVGHVNVFWVVVTLILFLGAAGFAYLQSTELGKEKTRRETLEKEKKVTEERVSQGSEQLSELTKLCGLVGDFKSRTGSETESRFTSPELLKAKLDELKKSFSVAGSNVAELVDPLGKALKAQEDLAKQAIADRDEARTQRQAQIDALAKVQTEKDTQITKLSTDVTEGSANLTRQMGTMNEQIANRSQALQKAQEELRVSKEASAKSESDMKKHINVLDARIDAQKNYMRTVNPPQEPDGQVIQALDSVGLAWINLGTRDQLPRGTVFRIMEKTKSGLSEKAHGVVTKVEMDQAELKITDVVDRYRPVVKGDLIANDLYSKGAHRNIVLMGRFSAPYAKPEVKLLLEQLGNKVFEKVSPQVDLVILGAGEFGETGTIQPLEETEEYKKSVNLGIEVIPLSKVKDLLKR